MTVASIANGWKAAELERVESRARQREFKTQALVSVASTMLNRHGYEGLLLSDVADALGITKQALYHYARNKQDLLFKCYDRALDLAEQAYDAADQAGGTGRDRIASFVRFHLNPESEPYASLDNLGALTEDNRKTISARAKSLEQRMRGFIQLGIRDHSIAEVDPKFTEFWILGALSWMPKWFKPDGRLSPDEVATSFLNLIFDGLRPRR